MLRYWSRAFITLFVSRLHSCPLLSQIRHLATLTHCSDLEFLSEVHCWAQSVANVPLRQELPPFQFPCCWRVAHHHFWSWMALWTIRIVLIRTYPAPWSWWLPWLNTVSIPDQTDLVLSAEFILAPTWWAEWRHSGTSSLTVAGTYILSL